MLAAAGIDVVDLGPSIEHDEGEHAYLLRAFADAEERQAKEDAFYGSAAWREGPRARCSTRSRATRPCCSTCPLTWSTACVDPPQWTRRSRRGGAGRPGCRGSRP
ncbi:hypothetical protein ACFQV2_18260 [Actinokineospora soli]|uniref:Uncharacterized protein n=1 Tax=Actinokineospora soli TaxID=1048753 RepID=A0ABW2TPS3_9PSEU